MMTAIGSEVLYDDVKASIEHFCRERETIRLQTLHRLVALVLIDIVNNDLVPKINEPERYAPRDRDGLGEFLDVAALARGLTGKSNTSTGGMM
jgi:hypothetical protein